MTGVSAPAEVRCADPDGSAANRIQVPDSMARVARFHRDLKARGICR